MLAGRDAGKSWAGTRWLATLAHRHPGTRMRIIAPTFGDAVAACIQGPSGILQHDPTATFVPSEPGGAVVKWPNGSACWVLGTPTLRDVDRLRALGNIQFDLFEEAAANPMLEQAVEQATLSRRLPGARWCATTTPRPRKTIKQWVADPTVAVSRATSFDNVHGDKVWRGKLAAAYAGTRLYRQEVEGEIIEQVEGARWQLDWLDRSRVQSLPDGRLRWAVGVDPASGSGTTGIVAVGAAPDGHLYVTDDLSGAHTPEQWASKAVDLARVRGGTIVAEKDQGGEMVRAALKAAGVDMPVKSARARSVGDKAARADPVAILWEKQPPDGHLVGSLPALEDQLTTWDPDDKGSPSPDRLDAMVWACLWLRSTTHGESVVTMPSSTFGGW